MGVYDGMCNGTLAVKVVCECNYEYIGEKKAKVGNVVKMC